MSGFILAINKQIINYQYGNVVIEPTKATQSNIYIKQADKVIGSIRNIPGILGAVQHYKSGVKITYNKNKKGNNVKNISASLFSIKPSEESKVLKINSHIVSGRYLKSRDRNKILIGREISGGFGATFDMKSLGGVKVGDEVYVHYPNGVNRKYEVVGIFSTKNFFG
jgi:putative ABC transport system permease protein